jgi:hypothetical protein
MEIAVNSKQLKKAVLAAREVFVAVKINQDTLFYIKTTKRAVLEMISRFDFDEIGVAEMIYDADLDGDDLYIG